MSENKMNAKEFRKEVGRELKRVSPKNNKEYRTYGYRLYRRTLRTVHFMLGVTPEKLATMNPKLRDETMLYIRGIVDWCEFLLTIQPREKQRRKKVEVNILDKKVKGEGNEYVHLTEEKEVTENDQG